MEAVAAKVAKENNDAIEEQKKKEWQKNHADLRERLAKAPAA